MAERSTPGAPNRYALVAMTPLQEQMLREAKAYHHITTPGMPSGWAFNGRGNLVDISHPEDAANPNQAPSVGLGVPNSAPGSSFGGQLLHALPYIAAAEFMGVPTALASGGAGAAGAGTAGVLPSTVTVPTSTGTVAGLSGATGLGTAAGTGAGVGTAATAAGLSAGTGAGTGAAGIETAGAGTAAGAGPMVGGTPLADFTGPIAQNAPATSSWLGGLGRFLGSNAGGAAIGAAGTLIGAGITSSGISHAADIQAQTAREALAYVKQRDQYLQNLEANRYAQYNARVQPYQDMANTTGDKLAKLLGVNPASYTYGLPGGADQPSPAIPPSIPTPGSGPAAGPYPNFRPRPPDVPAQGYAVPRSGVAPTNAMVMMRAPDGSTKQVPQTDVSHFTALGAQVIG